MLLLSPSHATQTNCSTKTSRLVAISIVIGAYRQFIECQPKSIFVRLFLSVLPPRARALTGFASVGSGQASSPGSSNQPSISQVPGVSDFSSSATNISSNNSATNQVVGIDSEQSVSATEVTVDEDLENLPPPPPPPDILLSGPPQHSACPQ